MDERWDISVCGLNCARCKLRAERECDGCRGPLETHWSPGCEFLPCAREKGYDYCFQCEDFPCGKLEAFENDGHDHHRLAVGHLRRMREIGLQAWIDEQPAVMFCPGWIF